jgi:predicted AAA+ superfamily ATPase
MHDRWFGRRLARVLPRPYVHILFGARQTGKSTLLRSLVPAPDLWIDLSNPAERSRYLTRPHTLVDECEALAATRRIRRPLRVVIDEAQSVPALFDAVQHLYDGDTRRYRFVLCGSSARKLRTTGANLLPGRAMLHRLYPLILPERPPSEGSTAAGLVLPMPAGERSSPFPTASLMDRLAFGDLPGIVMAARPDRAALLRSYAYVYLEEELRREALIKDWPTFARFLRLAALESGAVTNYARIASDAATTAPTVKSYYQLLEDMFVGFRIEPFTGSSRKQVLGTPRFYFFDLGVRHAAAELVPAADTVLANPGPVFEQWVGIELWKRLQYLAAGRLRYFRTKGGLEVDFVIERGSRVTPVEVQWTDRPSRHDARHLIAFLDDQGTRASRGYLVCRCPRPLQLERRVTALPWWAL